MFFVLGGFCLKAGGIATEDWLINPSSHLRVGMAHGQTRGAKQGKASKGMVLRHRDLGASGVRRCFE